MRVLVFGNFPSCVGYTRNRVVMRALRASGIECIEAQAPLFEDALSRKHAASSPWGLLGLSARAACNQRVLAKRYRAAEGSFDLVYVGYGGIGDQALARRLDREHDVPLVVDAFLSLYETAVLDRKLCREGSLRARWLKRLDRRIAERADLALVDTPDTARYLSDLVGLPASSWHAVPVGSELRQQPAPAASFTRRGLFVGTGVPLHGTTVLLRAMALIEGPVPSLQLTFVGGTARDRSLARELGLRSVTFIDRFVGPAELEEFHAASDFACGIFDQGEKAARVVPCKIYDALACGRAVVTADTPAVRAMLGTSAALHLVPAGSPEALARCLQSLSSCDLVAEGHAASQLFEERFTIERIGAQLRGLFEAVVAQRSGARRA